MRYNYRNVGLGYDAKLINGSSREISDADTVWQASPKDEFLV